MFFTRFPSTKLQDVNLDWLLKKICKLRGGTTNQVLTKASDADFDFKWVTGGGGGGTSDYNDLVNQPKINNVTLIGNLTGNDLGLLGSEALDNYRAAAAQDAIDAGKQAKITASGMLKGDGDGGVTAATAGSDYLAPAALTPYRTAAAQDVIDAGKQAKITASGMLKGDGDGGVTAATAGSDYLAPAALTPYRTAADQNTIDAGMAKADEVAIVITGSRPSVAVSIGQYVIVRGSTITGVTDGLYKAVNALSPSTDVTAADLTAVSMGGLNNVIKTTEQTHSTNSSGNWFIYGLTGNEIINVYCQEGAGYIFFPFKSNGLWYVKVIDWGSNYPQPVVNTTITATIMYY